MVDWSLVHILQNILFEDLISAWRLCFLISSSNLIIVKLSYYLRTRMIIFIMLIVYA